MRAATTFYCLVALACGSPAETPAPLPPASIVIHAGNNQTWAADVSLPIAPSVRVLDAEQAPVAGHAVTFKVVTGGGIVAGALQATDANGIATVGSWTLGKTPGMNRLSATALALPNSPAIITATGEVAFAELTAGGFHSCAIATHGKAYCWGWNDAFQLGAGTMAESSVPIPVIGTLSYSVLSAGLTHSCGIMDPGNIGPEAIVCWGDNSGGKLGDGTTTRRSSPTGVGSTQDYRAIGAGGSHTCALAENGEVLCWGRNGEGQIGIHPVNTERRTPTSVDAGGVAFASLAVGDVHNCALPLSGTAYCWGLNNEGQLGDGTTTNRFAPVQVAGGLAFKSIVAGFRHTCALTQAGKAYCWGRNSANELGDGTTTARLVPVEVTGGLTFASLAAYTAHTCGLTAAGAAHCWGGNFGGQLGDGTFTNRGSPVAVSGGFAFIRLAAGGSHTCGLTSERVTYCWGSNAHGKLGDGTKITRLAPVRVARP